MQIKKVGIAGAGVMGGGIAQMFAERGLEVMVWDVNKSQLDKGIDAIKKRLGKSVEKGGITPARSAEISGRIQAAAGLADFKDVHLAVEAVPEDFSIKKGIFSELEKHIADDAALATNTSSLSVGAIAAGLKTPARFLGMHFFNPPTKLELVEVVPAATTDPAVLAGVQAFLRACGKTPVVVKDSPGFIVNRLLLLLINEAARMVDDGVASAADIDTAMKLGAGHPMGPCELADFGGFDVIQMAQDAVFAYTHSESNKLNILYRKMLEAGRLGVKNGKGFYDYLPDGTKKSFKIFG